MPESLHDGDHDEAVLGELREALVQRHAAAKTEHRKMRALTWTILIMTAAILVLTGVLAWIALFPKVS